MPGHESNHNLEQQLCTLLETMLSRMGTGTSWQCGTHGTMTVFEGRLPRLLVKLITLKLFWNTISKTECRIKLKLIIIDLFGRKLSPKLNAELS